MTGRARNSTTQGVRKAVRLLHCFLEQDAPTLGVGELSQRTGWTKSSVSRLLSALREGGLVRQDPLTGRYAPGFELVALAGAALSAGPDFRAVRACLETLAEKSGETANLSIIDRGELLTLDEVQSPEPIKLSGWVGLRHPLYGSSSGKILLASMDEAAIDRILAEGLLPITPKTITQRRKLLEELRQARSQGYALNIEELAPGLTSAAAPIRGRGGEVVAAISVAGPTFRLTKRRLEQSIALVKRAGAEASRRLGFHAASSTHVGTKTRPSLARA